ncbi:MAG TPA: hypothetical protein VKT28_08025 [Puia sp.]|nr:hypothetical protein [Puia sp.]
MKAPSKTEIAQPRNKVLRVLAPSIYFIIIILASIYSYKRPAYNWDMLGYMALTLKIENPDINSVHNNTYSIAEREVPNWTYYHTLADSSNAFRKRMKENPASFNNQLAFYIIKPLYISFVYLFYKSGFSLSSSTVIPSVISFILISILLFYWLRKYLNIFFASVLALLVMLSPPLLTVAKLSTPDALSGLILFSSFYFIIEKPKFIFAILLMIISICTRLDNVITCILILSLVTFAARSPIKMFSGKYAFALALLLFCYYFVSHSTKKYGWNISFYSTFAYYLTSSSYQAVDTITLKDYSFLMYTHLLNGLYYSNITFLFLILSLLFLYPIKLNDFSFDQLFALTLFLIFIIRFILFPDISDRAYTAFYLTAVILLIRKISSERSLLLKHETV